MWTPDEMIMFLTGWIIFQLFVTMTLVFETLRAVKAIRATKGDMIQIATSLQRLEERMDLHFAGLKGERRPDLLRGRA